VRAATVQEWTRPGVSVAAGVAVTSASAVVLGDYPLSGAVPWLTPVLVPVLVGATMTLIDRKHGVWLWALTGPLAALAVLWGARIATGWGLDPWPISWWGVAAVALAWPPLWGVLSRRRVRSSVGAEPAAPDVANGHT